MRKLWIALVGAVVAAIAVAGIAGAANTYTVHIADASPGKGSVNRPIPTKLDFGYQVGDTENLRPQVVRQYRIAAEGTFTYPDARPDCTFTQANDPTAIDADTLPRPCRAAIVGSGTIDNEAGAPNDRTQKLTCDVQLTLINIANGDPRYPSDNRQIRRNGGIAIRIDTYQPEQSRCPIPVHEALAAPFFDVKIQGIKTTELRFPVPDTLAHPGGLDNAVQEVVSLIQKKTGRVRIKGKSRRVGFYSLVGRKGPTRTVRVTFVDESGDRSTATTQAR
jgi:hypothetical protein